MKILAGWKYRLLRGFLECCLRFSHPVAHIKGRENLPDGAALLCCNHSSFSDPIWVIVMAKFDCLPRTMAKQELLKIPVLGWLCRKLGAFPVDRGNTDITAIKTAMQTLRSQNRVLIFPEGTRVKKGERSEPHTGAMLIATRMKAPVVPIYLSQEKHFWRPVTLTFGAPYYPQISGAKPTPEELQTLTDELFEKIHAMGEST